jgi:hypothetical protein
MSIWFSIGAGSDERRTRGPCVCVDSEDFTVSLEADIDIGAPKSLEIDIGLLLSRTQILPDEGCNGGSAPEPAAPPGNFSLNEAALAERTDLPIGAAFTASEMLSISVSFRTDKFLGQVKTALWSSPSSTNQIACFFLT